MKKSILVLAALFSVAVMFTSCKDSKKEEVKTEDVHEHDGEEMMAAGEVYQCPMDCEKGKTYAEEGKCPVCEMDLKAVAGDTEMKHTANCTCKEGGECTCEGGKCQCQSETACAKCEPGNCTCKNEASATNCTKCEPGQCTCKAEAVPAEKAVCEKKKCCNNA
ncbi:hypothetical protein EC396_10660 [Lutibacter sp. HS1-25]|uniref:heavy metal-binding domain-containing protein n=1 Tax=Lutibacter sp. HS1-25 TaxID=2485000 RepID=UPI001011B1B8|nr:heavy metal-binding domain-containing protein [Lutibacter sp. HS1-25]RXP52955.1 hypothetical protein EC396_10660 [Lutibacter sp. HS1-25]